MVNKSNQVVFCALTKSLFLVSNMYKGLVMITRVTNVIIRVSNITE